jgi:hypothetical protein
MPLLLYSKGKNPWYPLDRRLGEPQNQSGYGVEEKNSQPHLEIKPLSSIHPAHSQLLYQLSYPGSTISSEAFHIHSPSLRAL